MAGRPTAIRAIINDEHSAAATKAAFPQSPSHLRDKRNSSSVGKLFAAGVIPGVLLWFRVTVYNAVRNYFQPELAPPLPPEERGNWSERFAALRAVLLPMGIILMVLGSILAGIATPTEAAALGVLGSLISAILHRRLNLRLIKEAAIRTFKLTGMVVWILFAAHAFSSAYQAMGAQALIMMFPAIVLWLPNLLF